jgi:hypothetical protein
VSWFQRAPSSSAARLGTIEGLNLALLVDRQDNGMGGRIDVEADDRVQFGGKLRIVSRATSGISIVPTSETFKKERGY